MYVYTQSNHHREIQWDICIHFRCHFARLPLRYSSKKKKGGGYWDNIYLHINKIFNVTYEALVYIASGSN